MAEARKLAGRVSAESEVTPRRSVSLNIFLQEGERLNVFTPSCQTDKCVNKKMAAQTILYFLRYICYHADLIRSSFGSHGEE